MNERAQRELAALGWTPDRTYDTSGIGARMPARGFSMFKAAEEFLARFGGLRVERTPPTPRGTTVYFHTHPESLPTEPWWLDAITEVSGTRAFPVGATAYGDYTLLIDERGRFFGIDPYGEVTFWAEDADELFDIVLGLGGTFRPCDAEDHRPL